MHGLPQQVICFQVWWIFYRVYEVSEMLLRLKIREAAVETFSVVLWIHVGRNHISLSYTVFCGIIAGDSVLHSTVVGFFLVFFVTYSDSEIVSKTLPKLSTNLTKHIVQIQ